MTIKEALEIIKRDPYSIIKYIHEKNVICQAIKEDIELLKYLDEYQNKEICLEAIKHNGLALQYVINKDYEICLEAVKQNGLAFMYVTDKFKEIEEIRLEAVKQNPYMIISMGNSSKNVWLEAINKEYELWDLCNITITDLDLIEKNALLLKYAKQNKNICLTAVKRNILALRYVNIKYVKYVYNYLKSINFEGLPDNYKFIIYKSHDQIDKIFYLDLKSSDDGDLEYYFWPIKYIRQNINILKNVINKNIKTAEISYDNLFLNLILKNVNYKNERLRLQIIKTIGFCYKHINKQFIDNLL